MVLNRRINVQTKGEADIIDITPQVEQEVARAKIKSVRQGKEDVTKTEKGGECGILFDGKVDFELQDAIIAYVRT